MPQQDDGVTFLELLIVIALIGIIAAFAVPRLLRARMTANETSAIASLRAISTAEFVFSRSCGAGGYAVSLPVLGMAPPGTTAAFLTPDLTVSASPQKSGYVYTLAVGAGAAGGLPDCHGNPTSTTFYTSAVPQTLNITGRRAFAMNTNRAIWEVYAAVAPSEPFGPPAVPIN